MNKYVTIFDYIDKILTVLSATIEGVCVDSHAIVVGVSVGIASAWFTFVFALATTIIKELLRITKSKKKKQDETDMLAKSKLNSIQTLVSQALIDLELSHEQFITILKEKGKYEKIKENVKNKSEKLEKKAENMRLNSVKSRS